MRSEWKYVYLKNGIPSFPMSFQIIIIQHKINRSRGHDFSLFLDTRLHQPKTKDLSWQGWFTGLSSSYSTPSKHATSFWRWIKFCWASTTLLCVVCLLDIVGFSTKFEKSLYFEVISILSQQFFYKPMIQNSYTNIIKNSAKRENNLKEEEQAESAFSAAS